jgi:hypothetical protein
MIVDDDAVLPLYQQVELDLSDSQGRQVDRRRRAGAVSTHEVLSMADERQPVTSFSRSASVSMENSASDPNRAKLGDAEVTR